jgi:adenine phosphoribosyltransferase
MAPDLKTFISDIPDFPKPGILFRDISPLLNSPDAFRHAVRLMAQEVAGHRITSIVAIESRGFIFAAPVAHELGVPLVLARKPGKLPGDKTRIEYGLEYGSDALELKHGLIDAGSRVAIIDDVLATGGTARATGDLVQKVGATVASYTFLVELRGLAGREKLSAETISSLIEYQ